MTQKLAIGTILVRWTHLWHEEDVCEDKTDDYTPSFWEIAGYKTTKMIITQDFKERSEVKAMQACAYILLRRNSFHTEREIFISSGFNGIEDFVDEQKLQFGYEHVHETTPENNMFGKREWFTLYDGTTSYPAVCHQRK